MERSVICAIDSSESRHVIPKVAEWFAAGLGDRLLLTHVVEPWRRFPYGHELYQERQDRRAVSEAEQLLGSIDIDSEFERHLLYGDPVEALADFATTEGADLIVVGSTGDGPLKAALRGTVGRGLVRKSSCPVLIVPPTAGERVHKRGSLSGRTLVCGVDISSEESAHVAIAARLASSLGLELVLVHALRPMSAHAARGRPRPLAPPDLSLSASRLESAAAQQLEELAEGTLDEEVRSCRRRVIRGLPAEVLRETAEEEDAAFVAVGNRGFGAVKSLLRGSASRELAAAAPTPVLVVPPAAKPGNGGGPSAVSLQGQLSRWG